MAKKSSKGQRKSTKPPSQTETPPGATRKALNRPPERGDGPPGSGAGPRHASDDAGTESETWGRTDTTRTPAGPSIEEEEPLEKGPPFAGASGGAVGGTPAQLRSVEGAAGRQDESDEAQTDSTLTSRMPPESNRAEGMIRLTGDAAIEYAEKQGLLLNKHPDSITGPRVGLNIAEAQAIADEDPDLIWLDVEEDDYYSGPPSDCEPAR
jgi:hypothetical protein